MTLKNSTAVSTVNRYGKIEYNWGLKTENAKRDVDKSA
jgi:hypothetical protein